MASAYPEFDLLARVEVLAAEYVSDVGLVEAEGYLCSVQVFAVDDEVEVGCVGGDGVYAFSVGVGDVEVVDFPLGLAVLLHEGAGL